MNHEIMNFITFEQVEKYNLIGEKDVGSTSIFRPVFIVCRFTILP